MKQAILTMLLCSAAATAVAQNASSDKGNAQASDLQEIVVTGTLIRGTAPTGSQLITVDNAAIVATGATSTASLLSTVPQLAGFNSFPQGGAVNADASGASAPSLHALPPAATLVLLNGHRLVGDSPLNTYPDPSSIPPQAIERVEIVADGGSAIYGSDAVAGVINIILKKNYEGAETTATYGGASKFNTSNIGQTFGKTWTGGSAFVAAGYESNSNLSNSDRGFYTANLSPFGGQDLRTTSCSPANVRIGTTTYAAPNLLPGPATKCDPAANADLINPNRRYSVVGTVQQDVNEHIHLFLDAKYTDDLEHSAIASNVVGSSTIDNTNPFFVAPPGTGATSETILYNTGNLGAQSETFRAKSGMVDFGATMDLGHTWQMTADFNYGWSKSSALDAGFSATLLGAALSGTTPATALDPFGNNTSPATASAILDFPSIFSSQQNLYDFHLKADGTIFTLPGGDLKLAAGGEFRKETYAGFSQTGEVGQAGESSASVSTFRNVDSGFAEVLLPVFGANNSTLLLHRLDLSAAVRYDRYSDFGSTTNPKYGIGWSPVDGVSFRASYGHSFHAPALSDLDAVDSRALLFPGFPLVPPGSPFLNTIVLAGGNPGLRPETAKTQSFGVDFAPPALPGFKGSLSYFIVRYTDQIAVAPLNEQVFLNPALFNLFVIENPTAAQIQAAICCIRPTFTLPLPPIQQIIDFRRNNIGATDVEGWDFDFRYATQMSAGTLSFGLGGSYLTEYETAQAPGSVPVDNITSGAAYINGLGIVPWHVRGTVGWAAGPFTTQAALNYTGSYKNGYISNAGAAAIQDVKSYTTVDWFASWDLPFDGVGKNTNVSLNVYNILDDTPPLLLVTGGFSSLTANPIGRMISLTLRKRW